MKAFFITLALGALLLEGLTPQKSKPAIPPATDDPYSWLEEVSGEKALAWVKERNAESTKELAEGAAFQRLKTDLLTIMDSKARIPEVSKRGSYYYNFWKDAQNPRVLWRRTSPEEFRKAEPKWDTIIDLDPLAKTEKENWVWRWAQILKAGGYRHCLIILSGT